MAKECADCGKDLSWLSRLVGNKKCQECLVAPQKREEKEREEFDRKPLAEQNWILKKRAIPEGLKDKGIINFVEDLTHEKPVTAGYSFWENEDSAAEKFFGGFAARVATSGFAGYQGTIPFGIVGVSLDKLWRIELGYVHGDFSFTTIHDQDIISFSLSELDSEIELGSENNKLTFKSKKGGVLLSGSASKASLSELTLVFPKREFRGHRFERHPFYEYVPANNKEIACEITKLINNE